jgi:protein-arginine kinase activator protein McsA
VCDTLRVVVICEQCAEAVCLAHLTRLGETMTARYLCAVCAAEALEADPGETLPQVVRPLGAEIYA